MATTRWLASTAASAIAEISTLPLDVAKTRLQTGVADGGTFPLMLKIVRAEGVAALFTGWSAAVCRAFPANAGLFADVELMSRLLKDDAFSAEELEQLAARIKHLLTALSVRVQPRPGRRANGTRVATYSTT